MLNQNIEQLLKKIKTGDRVALSQAITLIESRSIKQRELARQLITRIPPPDSPSLCIAISGAPGVGKSTFIEAMGLYLINEGHQPAILTVDPSSHLTGGSILGDRTRMEELSRSDKAFIRQSPSSNFLGGVTRRTREAILLCELSGHDVIIVETVGIGQSEYLAADLTDIFCLLVQPGSGDELQGVKKGVMEMADLLVVTKADSDLEQAAARSVKQLRNAVHILQEKDHGRPRTVFQVSAMKRKGLGTFWKNLKQLQDELMKDGYLQEQRRAQKVVWLKDVIEEIWLEQLYQSSSYNSEINRLGELVYQDEMHVYEAALKMIEQRWKEGH